MKQEQWIIVKKDANGRYRPIKGTRRKFWADSVCAYRTKIKSDLPLCDILHLPGIALTRWPR